MNKVISLRRRRIPLMYKRLFAFYGPQKWWPAKTRLEVIVGAILTQNTNWGNVERAIVSLQRENLLSLERLRKISSSVLARHIRSCGYYNIKARRLKNFVDFVFCQYDGSLERMRRQPLVRLREHILSVNGVGPETADSILLYAFRKPIFVVDAYTQRILRRHGIINGPQDYHQMQQIFMRRLPREPQLFNEYHALLVRVGKDYCRTQPRCGQCPLKGL